MHSLFSIDFFGKKQGVIVESGALDGMTYSTSYFFERTLEWRSVHIEASPINYKKLVMYRKLSINIHAALCTNSTTLHFLDGRTGGKGGRATSGIAEFMNIKFVERFHPEVKLCLKHSYGSYFSRYNFRQGVITAKFCFYFLLFFSIFKFSSTLESLIRKEYKS